MSKVQIYDCAAQSWRDVNTDDTRQGTLIVTTKGEKSGIVSSYGTAKGGSKVWSGYGHGTTTYVACKHFPKDVLFDIDGVDVYAGEKYELKNCRQSEWPNALFVNCMGSAAFEPKAFKNPVKTLPDKLKDAGLDAQEWTFAPEVMPDEMVIDWTDRGMPELRAAWWREFPKLVKEAGYKEMVVFCFGGHGRTGTALASLMIANGIEKDPIKAIEWVRKNHCSKAIEGSEQELYIKWVAELLWQWQEPTEK